uniref:DNA mismatch repair protein MSH3 n=1 Tax=Oryza meridionalis TaxID=40149 RepID=A0A0E0DKD1_9ORYZ
MVSSSSPVVNVYPLANYTFGTKEPKMEKDTSVADRLARMKVNYMKEGMRTSVEAILLVQEHNHPHILLLQIGNTFCKLPGGRLKPGENEIEGLKRKLCSKLAVNSPSFPPNWQVGECVAVWWRPNFETVMYPYCPPHITKPKECKKLFIVHLSEREYFAVPRNLKLLAVPLFELYDNVQRYGPVISTIPQQLSRFQFNMSCEQWASGSPPTSPVSGVRRGACRRTPRKPLPPIAAHVPPFPAPTSIAIAMGKPKQQVLSRFFSPKPRPSAPAAADDPPPPPRPPADPPVAAVVSFSPAKRARALSVSPKTTAKRAKPSPPPSDYVRRRLLEPPRPPPPLAALNPSGKGYTPLEQQVVDLKARHPDVLLMVEVGYRFRFFGEDAAVAASVLGIIAHPDHSFLTASIPTFRLGFHVRRLVAAGHKVGVVRQTETAAIKAAHGGGAAGTPFARGLSAVYTRATIEAAAGELEGGGAPDEGSRYLVCVVDREVDAMGTEGFEVKIGVVAIEVSTGEVVHGEFMDGVSRNGLEAVLLGLAPVEVILGTPISFATEKLMVAYAGPTSNVRVERTSRVCFSEGGALAELLSLFEKSGVDAPTVENGGHLMEMNEENNNPHGIEGIMAMPELVVHALALSVRYLKGFGMDRIICFGSSFRPFTANTEMSLSANTLQQLELTHPLCDRNQICARHDAVSEISESIGSQKYSTNNLQDEEDMSCSSSVRSDLSTILSSVLRMLAGTLDIQRGITRIFHVKATAKEFVGVVQAILTAGKQLQKLVLEDTDTMSSQHRTVHSPLLRRLINTASSCTVLANAATLVSCLNKDAADQGDMLNLFIASVDQFPEVAEGHATVEMAKQKLELLITEYRKQLGLPVDRKVPSSWMKVNSTKKTIRYHTPEVSKNLENLLLAKEKLAVICRTTWNNFLMDFGRYYAQFQATVESLATLDCLYSLATLAKQNKYVRPNFVHENEASQIHIKDGRHPVLESLLGVNFVPNDTELHANGEYCQIVTGPNMGGKSCYIRQVALITLMAQVGSFVPASSATLHVVDGIYTRMGASDSIQHGTSTFYEELSEASNILHNCSSRSLVIIDELGRGTSTHDGVAIAYATLHYLLKEKKCMVIFVTHYPKILNILREFEGSVGAYHVSYLATRKLLEVSDRQMVINNTETKDLGEITFLYKLVAGASDRSFGLNVALLAQLPSSCIERASVMAAKLQQELSEREKNKFCRLMDVPRESSPKELCAQPYQGLAEACHRILFNVTSAQRNDDLTDTLFSLREAREIALKAIKGWWQSHECIIALLPCLVSSAQLSSGPNQNTHTTQEAAALTNPKRLPLHNQPRAALRLESESSRSRRLATQTHQTEAERGKGNEAASPPLPFSGDVTTPFSFSSSAAAASEFINLRPFRPAIRLPGIPIGAAGNGFRACSLRRLRHRGCGGNPMGASALGGCGSRGLFYLAPNHGSPLALRTRGRALRCQGNDSLAYVDGPLEGTNGSVVDSTEDEANSSGLDEEKGDDDAENLRDLLQKARKELEVARLNSTMFEEKAQRISESAIALKDRADKAQSDVSSAVMTIQEIISKEADAKEAVRTATMALSMAEARLQLASEALDAKRGSVGPMEVSIDDVEEEALASAQEEIKECQESLSKCEEELRRIQEKKMELQKEVDRLTELAERALLDASKAEEDVANIMVLAEQAVALEMEAAQRANDAELALQKAEKAISSVDAVVELPAPAEEQVSDEEDNVSEVYDYSSDAIDIPERDEVSNVERLIVGDLAVEGIEQLESSREMSDDESTDKLLVEPQKEAEPDIDKSKQGKKQEIERKESQPSNAPKASLKRSSRFFPASFFSSKADGEFTPTSVFKGLMKSTRKHAPKLVVGIVLLGAGAFFLNRAEKSSQLFQQQEITTSIEEVTSTAKPIVREMRKIPQRVKKLIELLPHQEVNEEEASLFDILYLLLASVVFVPLFQKIPGGSPVLGYLAAGVLIGPYGLSIIRHVHGTKAIAEFGVVFLLFNIGLEDISAYHFLPAAFCGKAKLNEEVLATTAAVGMIAHRFAVLPGPAAIVIGSGLALSSTAVVLQVLQERGESTSRHGRATFSVLLFQDLAVVVLLILIPLISPNSSKGGVGFQAIAEAMGMAAVKAIAAITAIIAGGRLLLRPIYKQIAENRNAEIFSANTLLVIFGTSLLTARAGLSMALGAFLAGLLLAETEFSLQVESDIAPYRGLLLGLFFMTVGMSIDPKLLLSNFPAISVILGLLIIGKTMLVTFIGRVFGISTIAAVRVGLLLAPGGEFAFVAFGEAVNQGLLSPQLSSLLFLVVGISMALTPWLAAGGQFLASKFEQHDVRSLLPVESETDDLQDHIIILGFGRVGQIIAQLLSERLIPFVALDVRSDRVAVGRALDLPVYFGDAGSREVLHKVGAERACAAAITLDTPGANYRAVWALSKYFPNVKTFVRAHDVDHGVNLEKAGATAVVPETLEPSLQLAAAVLAQAKLPMSEIAATVNEFRNRHLSELTELCATSGSSLGYGYSRVMSISKSKTVTSDDESETVDGALAI